MCGYVSVLQEYVSCLNTSLVLLMSRSKSIPIERYLRALKEEAITYTSNRIGGSNVMRNFR